MLPLVAGAVTAVKGSVVTEGLDRVAEGLQGLFGDTSTDKARKQRAASLLARGLAGDNAAIVQLGFDAFEPRRGLPGDNRTPTDGKQSPEDVRALARKALQEFVRRGGNLPPQVEQYADRLGAIVMPKRDVIQQLTDPILSTIGAKAGSAAVDAAEKRAVERGRELMPLLVIGGGILAVVLIYAFNRRG
jgi:hypothetical protein